MKPQYQILRDLFPICRSLSGPGTRATLNYIADLLPGFELHGVASGTRSFDWIVPDEWTIRDAHVSDSNGRRIIDFKAHNLHVVGYSEPVDTVLDLPDLEKHLYSLPDQPEAIPYVTSYYKRRWGFCLAHNVRLGLKEGKYRVVIDSELKPGILNYGELVLPGESKEEILLSTYICHPSMANNELSGPVVTAALAHWLSGLPKRRFTYRIVWVPETIGSIVYISKHLDHLKEHVVAGFNVTCVGDDRCYSYLPSRGGNTLSDRIAVHVLSHIDPNFKRYTWFDRGSDERQYCSPGVDLPIATIMRSKYGTYPEYHTSLDNLDFVTQAGLEGGFRALQKALQILEENQIPVVNVKCEPQLGKRGLYPEVSIKGSASAARNLMNIISLCDGTLDFLGISDLLSLPFAETLELIQPLIEQGLVGLGASCNNT